MSNVRTPPNRVVTLLQVWMVVVSYGSQKTRPFLSLSLLSSKLVGVLLLKPLRSCTVGIERLDPTFPAEATFTRSNNQTMENFFQDTLIAFFCPINPP